MAHTDTGTDSINRIAWGFGALAAFAGVAIVFSAPWSLPTVLPPRAAAVFVFDPDFLPVGGAVVGLVWLFNAMLFAVVYADGRWRDATRHLDLALTAVWCGVLLWLTIGPRIFLSPTTDAATKAWMGVVLVIVVVSSIPKVYRVLRRS